MSEKRGEVERDRNQLTNARRSPSMIEQRFAVSATQRPSDLELLILGEDINFDGLSADGNVKGLAPRTDDNPELREIALQLPDLGGCPFSRIGIQLVPPVQCQNQARMMGEQHEMLLSDALKCRTGDHGAEETFPLSRPGAERDKQGNGASTGDDCLGHLKERRGLAGAGRRNYGELVERLDGGRQSRYVKRAAIPTFGHPEVKGHRMARPSRHTPEAGKVDAGSGEQPR